MTQRVGAKGQVVIPKDIRDELGLQPGSEVDFEREGDGVRILPAGAAGTRGLRAGTQVSVCLDSWAVLAWLDGDEPAASAVQEAFDAERPWMSWLKIGEVAYQLERGHGADEAAVVVGRWRA